MAFPLNPQFYCQSSRPLPATYYYHFNFLERSFSLSVFTVVFADSPTFSCLQPRCSLNDFAEHTIPAVLSSHKVGIYPEGAAPPQVSHHSVVSKNISATFTCTNIYSFRISPP